MTTKRRGNGEGSVSAEPGRGGYVGKVRVTDPSTGASRRVTVRGKTRKEVRDKLREVVKRSEAGRAVDEGRAENRHVMIIGELDEAVVLLAMLDEVLAHFADEFAARIAAVLEPVGDAARAGADAIELNLYSVAADPNVSGQSLEAEHFGLVALLADEITIPLAVKISPHYSSLASFVLGLQEAGAAGVVMFNRFYLPDFDLESGGIVPRIGLSTPAMFHSSGPERTNSCRPSRSRACLRALSVPKRLFERWWVP